MGTKTKIVLIVLAVVIVLAAVGVGIWYWLSHKDKKESTPNNTPNETSWEFTADGDLEEFDHPEASASDLNWTKYYNATHELMEKLAEYGLIESPEALYDGSKGIDRDLLLKMVCAGGFTREQLTNISDILLAAFDKIEEHNSESMVDSMTTFLTVMLPAISEALENIEVEQIQAAVRVYGEAKFDSIRINWSDKDGKQLWSQENASREKDLLSILGQEDRDEYDFMLEGVSYSRENAYYFLFDSDAAYYVLQSLKEMIQGFGSLDSDSLSEAIGFAVNAFSAMINGGIDTMFADDIESLTSGANALGELLRAGVDNISDRRCFDLAYTCLNQCEIDVGYYQPMLYYTQALYYGWSDVQLFLADCLRGLTPEFLNGIKTAKQNVAEASEEEYNVAYGELVARVGAFIKPYFDNMNDDAKEALCSFAEVFFEIKGSVDEFEVLFTHCAEKSVDEMTDADKERIAREYFDFEPVETESVSVKFDVNYPEVIALPAGILDEELCARMLKYTYTFHDVAGENEDRTKLLSFSLDSNEHGFATLTVSYPGYTITQAVYMYDGLEDRDEMIFDDQSSVLYGFTFEKGKAPTQKTILDKILSKNSIKMRTRDSWREISIDRYDYQENTEFSVIDFDPGQAPGNYVGYVFTETWAGTWVMPFGYHIADPNATQLCGFSISIKDQYLQDEDFEIRSATAIYDYGLYKYAISELSNIEVKGFDSSKAGKQMVTFTYRGYTITREILIIQTHAASASDETSDGYNYAEVYDNGIAVPLKRRAYGGSSY